MEEEEEEEHFNRGVSTRYGVGNTYCTVYIQQVLAHIREILIQYYVRTRRSTMHCLDVYSYTYMRMYLYTV